MRTRPAAQVPTVDDRFDELVDRLAGRAVVLFVEVDGVLAGLRDDRDAVSVAPATRELVTRLARACTLALVSGRDVADLRQRLPVSGCWYVASHGFELEAPDGDDIEQQTIGAAIAALDRAEHQLAATLGDAPDVHLTRERFGVAVGLRGVDVDTADEVVAAVEAIAADDVHLCASRGQHDVELRPDVNWDLATALGWLLDRVVDERDGDDTIALYVGRHPLVDPDRLPALYDPGATVLVRDATDDDRPTSAHLAVDGVDGAHRLLERLGAELAQDRSRGSRRL